MGRPAIKICNTHLIEKHLHSDGRWRCLKCVANSVRGTRHKHKIILVEEAGGKCIECGYNKNFAALEFHHRLDEDKSFEISKFLGRGSLDSLRKEAAKCDLLCANCHAEAHCPEQENQRGMEQSGSSSGP